MPSSDHSKTQQEPASPEAGWMSDAELRTVDAVADMQERLAQFGRLVEQLRDELPEQQVGALARIEQGIATLGERIAAFGQTGHAQEGTGTSLSPTVPADLDEPWDAQSAEALMRSYEMAESELASSGQPARRLARPEATKAAAAAATGYDQAWLEGRFADIAALLQHSLADINPARSLAALDRRLDQFEQRLDAALNDIVAYSGRDGLNLIEAHIKELTGHFEATCRQLTRLDTMDDHLRELMQAVDEHGQQSKAGPAALSDDAIAALVDSAAERAVTRMAASGPAAGMASEAEAQKRIDALESLVQDYIAERRRGEDVTGGILNTIESALTRIADRVDAIEVGNSGHAGAADDDAQDRDGIDLESHRLAEAYAAGARVLGREPLEPDLDAADYAPRPARIEQAATETPTVAKPVRPAEDATATPDAQTRHGLRASAMRAKMKAQAAQEIASASAELDQAKASMLKDRRARLPAITGSHRFSLLLGVAMAFLCGTGFLVVDAFLPNAPPAGAKQTTAASQAQVEPVAGVAPPTSEPVALDPQHEVEVPKSNLAPRTEEQAPAAAREPAPRQPEPETATDNPNTEQPAPTRRLSRLSTGSTSPPADATPAMLSQPSGNRAWATEPAGPTLPSSMGTAELRSAAISGDARAQFEIASRFAEGKGVAQDHKQAFAWYERAATRGLVLAQFRLGAYYERGVGTTPDRERARVWYRRAAEQGYVRAMHNLAVLSVGGGEAQADYPTAAGWFRKAAERGLTDSQFNLGILYENGRGVPRDLQEAYKWYALAARSADPVAARRLDQIKARMDQAGLDAAELKLAAWQPIPTPADPVATR